MSHRCLGILMLDNSAIKIIWIFSSFNQCLYLLAWYFCVWCALSMALYLILLQICFHIFNASILYLAIELTPTFAGCPAIHHMKENIVQVLAAHGVAHSRVDVMYNEPWSTNLISPRGRQLLKDFGLSPPPAFDGMLTLDVLQGAICPKCSSNNTFMMNAFGPTACRAVHHCRNCRETFEQFKPL